MNLRDIMIAPSVVMPLCLGASSAVAQVSEAADRYRPSYHGHDMMWGDSQWGGFGMFLGPIFMILIVVGIVAVIIYLLRQPGGAGLAGGSHPAHDSALALLKERYAKGEIDSEEFAERKKLLAE